MTRHFIRFPLVGRYPPDHTTPRFETVSSHEYIGLFLKIGTLRTIR
jgi:hypothetical protein